MILYVGGKFPPLNVARLRKAVCQKYFIINIISKKKGSSSNGNKRERASSMSNEQASSPKKIAYANQNEKEEVWKVDSSVCVRLTSLIGFKDFQFCHMDGTISKRIDSTTIVVNLEQLKRIVTVTHDRLAHIRQADEKVNWQKGDKVHVLQTIANVNAWWEATIISPWGQKWAIEWTGEYEGYPDKARVPGSLIRRAE